MVTIWFFNLRKGFWNNRTFRSLEEFFFTRTERNAFLKEAQAFELNLVLEFRSYLYLGLDSF